MSMNTLPKPCRFASLRARPLGRSAVSPRDAERCHGTSRHNEQERRSSEAICGPLGLRYLPAVVPHTAEVMGSSPVSPTAKVLANGTSLSRVNHCDHLHRALIARASTRERPSCRQRTQIGCCLTAAQSAAAIVAIVGGFLVNRVVALSSERSQLSHRHDEIADRPSQRRSEHEAIHVQSGDDDLRTSVRCDPASTPRRVLVRTPEGRRWMATTSPTTQRA